MSDLNMSALRSLEKAKAHVIYIQNDLFLMLERKIFNLPCQHISSGNLFLSLLSLLRDFYLLSADYSRIMWHPWRHVCDRVIYIVYSGWIRVESIESSFIPRKSSLFLLIMIASNGDAECWDSCIKKLELVWNFWLEALKMSG